MADKDELIPSPTSSANNDNGDKKVDAESSKESGKLSKQEKSEKEPKEQNLKFAAIPNLYSKFVQSFESALNQLIGMFICRLNYQLLN